MMLLEVAAINLLNIKFHIYKQLAYHIYTRIINIVSIYVQ